MPLRGQGGAEYHPWQRKTWQKSGKRGKNQEKEGKKRKNWEEKAKIEKPKVLSLCPSWQKGLATLLVYPLSWQSDNPPSFLLFRWLFWLSWTSGQVLISNTEYNWVGNLGLYILFKNGMFNTFICTLYLKSVPEKKKVWYWYTSNFKIPTSAVISWLPSLSCTLFSCALSPVGVCAMAYLRRSWRVPGGLLSPDPVSSEPCPELAMIWGWKTSDKAVGHVKINYQWLFSFLF